jgi:pyruvate kinase
MTKIITTIGPASQDIGTLMFFAEHGVEIARLNFSHNIPQWHIETGKKARQAGLKLMVDLAGPKVLVGDLDYELEVEQGTLIIFEKQNHNKKYPLWEKDNNQEILVLPCYFNITEFVKVGDDILIDDGKVNLVIEKIENQRILSKVKFGGKIKSHKGINLPDTDLKIDFLVERDRDFLMAVLPKLKPEIIAPSFVKTSKDLNLLNSFIQKIKEENNMLDYNPEICTKVEMGEVVEDKNLNEIIEKSQMIMIARGDLALEAKPLHIGVPFLQEKIKKLCQQKNTPFVIATQILESMFSSPVPTRAEVSDLYRAVVIDKADYIMLSAESAAGKYARKCVELMHEMISKV